MSVGGLLNDAWVAYEEVVGRSAWPFSVEKRDLTGKWALVTGGNLGIGLELSRLLLELGCSVIVASRPGKPGERKEELVEEQLRKVGLKNGQAVAYWAFDGASLQSTKALADRWLDSGRALDFLFGNHGIADPELSMTGEGHERTYAINFLSHAYLSLLLLPALAKADRPRIVSSGSCFHWFGGRLDWDKLNSLESEQWWMLMPFLMKYGRAKLCLAMFNRELAVRLETHEAYRRIVVHTVHPGVIKSRLFTDLYDVRHHPMRTLGSFAYGTSGISTENGARTLLKSAVSDDHQRAVRSGQYFNRAWPRRPRPEVNDPAARRKLWDRVFEECHLDEASVLHQA